MKFMQALTPVVTLDQILALAEKESGISSDVLRGPLRDAGTSAWRQAVFMTALAYCSNTTRADLGRAFHRDSATVSYLMRSAATNELAQQRKDILVNALRSTLGELPAAPAPMKQPVGATLESVLAAGARVSGLGVDVLTGPYEPSKPGDGRWRAAVMRAALRLCPGVSMAQLDKAFGRREGAVSRMLGHASYDPVVAAFTEKIMAEVHAPVSRGLAISPPETLGLAVSTTSRPTSPEPAAVPAAGASSPTVVKKVRLTPPLPSAPRAAPATGTVNPFRISVMGAEGIREKAQRIDEMWAKALGGQKFESLKVKTSGRVVRLSRAPSEQTSGGGTAAALCVEAA